MAPTEDQNIQNRPEEHGQLSSEQENWSPDMSRDNFSTIKGDTSTAVRLSDNDVATNSGSTINTLDTAFHDIPDHLNDPLSGSNRADLYETRSYGKTDAEEEMDVLRKNQQQK